MILFGQIVQTGQRKENVMLKKIRRFYWHRRDRGLGRQMIMVAIAFVLFLILMVGLIARNIVNRGDLESGGQNQAVTGSVVETEVATRAAIEETASVEQEESTQKQEVIHEKTSVDTSGLSTFLGFMSETAYAELEKQLLVECQNRGCNAAKKLTFQQTKENSYDVTSFILLSDGSVYECRYNLKSCVMTLAKTSYTEADVNQMKEKQLQAEQEELEKQQEKEKKKLEKKKASQKKKAKKSRKKSSKKTSKKVSGKKKSAKVKKK